ncbi:hypothetical protein [Psychromonas sp. GE-S-Ul-11]|uniref:hypothetical protein n=1 Tax=unclassified Psychromonas TaxID=2614957 RepID=UPI00390C9716
MFNSQQSSILSEQELHLLLSSEQTGYGGIFPLYSLIAVANIDIKQKISDLSTLILQLSSSPLGSAVILNNSIESHVQCDSLIQLLKEREDLQIFWLGELPSMAIDLPSFDHCQSTQHLQQATEEWQHNSLTLFNRWLKHYKTGLISEYPPAKRPKQLQGLDNLYIYTAEQSLTNIHDLQLLIIDLNTPNLRLMEVLNNLMNLKQRPFLMLYGKMQANLSHALYDLTNSLGFTILASLSHIPNTQQSRQILISLFSKIYLKHLIQQQKTDISAHPLFLIDHHTGQIGNKPSALLCPYGMSQKQISSIKLDSDANKIVNVKSIFDWFPDGVNYDRALLLAERLSGGKNQIDLYIKYPQSIAKPSPFFSLIVMARLNNSKIYWFIEDTQSLSIDMLMSLPISDIIFSKTLALQLFDTPSQYLFDFIQAAQQQTIRLGAVMEFNKVSIDALSLHGIEFTLDPHTSEF